ncbi:MAG: hypothetical protein WC728_04690 [Elusimicrobiota bacterium]
MGLSALVALPVALGPIAVGVFGASAHAAIQAAVWSGTALWLLWRVFVGYLPIPSRRNLLWSAALALLAGAAGSRDMMVAVWMFPVMTALSKDARSYVDEAVRVSAWLIMALAVHQRLAGGASAPSSVYASPPVLAGAALMLLPVSLERGDRLLAAGLAAALLWTGSLGAWLGLSAGLAVAFRGRNRLWSRLGLVGSAACAVAIYGQLGSVEWVQRWEGWKAAFGVMARQPLLGCGPGGLAEGHQYYLATAAEAGIPFALLWFGGLWHCLRGRSYKQFGLGAVLVQSLWDSPFSSASNLWLLSYLAASSTSETSEGVDIPSRARPWAGLLVLLGAWRVLTL